jgi:hypothetical protein
LTVLIGVIVGWTVVIPVLVLLIAMLSARKRERDALELDLAGLGQPPTRWLGAIPGRTRPAQRHRPLARVRSRCEAAGLLKSKTP